MDDFLFFAHDKASLLTLRRDFSDYLGERLALAIKPPLIQRCGRGFLFCGVRIKPHRLRPSQRRRRRYRAAVLTWEGRWRRGEIDGLRLQCGFEAARAILLPADDPSWRRRCLVRAEAIDV